MNHALEQGGKIISGTEIVNNENDSIHESHENKSIVIRGSAFVILSADFL